MPDVDFYFDYASPFSYLADALAPRAFEGIRVNLRPIYLRGLESFSKGVPYGATKLNYVFRDFARCAAHEKVPVVTPASFPINGLYALRGALAAEKEGVLARYHAAMFRATWAEGLDVSSKEVVASIARKLGLDRVVATMDEGWVKDELKARTEAAVARGVFGAPTFIVGDELFWGHDRMDYAARAARAVTPS